MMKIDKNNENAKNGRKRMRSFGALSEPELSKKKCSEELGSRSIDWRRQMAHRAKIKMRKKGPRVANGPKIDARVKGLVGSCSKSMFLLF